VKRDRYGGEEFAVILPGADVEIAEKIANRIRTTFEAHRFTPEVDGKTAMENRPTLKMIPKAIVHSAIFIGLYSPSNSSLEINQNDKSQGLSL
jgi:GGDEF domain-containing protein